MTRDGSEEHLSWDGKIRDNDDRQENDPPSPPDPDGQGGPVSPDAPVPATFSEKSGRRRKRIRMAVIDGIERRKQTLANQSQSPGQGQEPPPPPDNLSPSD